MVKQEIIPSVIAKNQKALDKIIKKVKNKSNRIQLDVMDKKFVKNSSLDFDFKLPKLKQKVEDPNIKVIQLKLSDDDKYLLNKEYKK